SSFPASISPKKPPHLPSISFLLTQTPPAFGYTATPRHSPAPPTPVHLSSRAHHTYPPNQDSCHIPRYLRAQPQNSCSQSAQSPRSGTPHLARGSRSTSFLQIPKSLSGASSSHSPVPPLSPPLRPHSPDRSPASRSVQAAPVSPGPKRASRQNSPPSNSRPSLPKFPYPSNHPPFTSISFQSMRCPRPTQVTR